MGTAVSDQDILEALLQPENDRAWKLAMGHTVSQISEQTQKTNGRVTRLERFQWTVTGGLAVVMAIVVPIFLKLVIG